MTDNTSPTTPDTAMIARHIEAIMMVADEPMSVIALAGALEEPVSAVTAALDELVAERRLLERRANQLRPESLDPDMLDEQARWMLGLAHPDEVILAPEGPR